MSSTCFAAVIVVRTTDRLKLCSMNDTAFQQAKGQALAGSLLRDHPDRVLERMRQEEGVQSFDATEVTYFVQRGPSVTVLVVGNKAAPIFQQHGIDLLETATCKLMEEIQSEFLAHFPEDVVASASKPFQFLNWDRQLMKLVKKSSLSLQKYVSAPTTHGSATVGAHTTLLRRTHTGASSAPASGPSPGGVNATYDALRKELADVRGVMKQNLDDILTRGESLETVSHYSSQLKDNSQGYYKRTVHMNRMRMLQLYGPPAVVLLIVLLWLWWYFG